MLKTYSPPTEVTGTREVGCGEGKVIMAFDVHRHWRCVNELLRGGTPFAMVTMVDMRGSAPQIQGAKAIVTAMELSRERSGVARSKPGPSRMPRKCCEAPTAAVANW